MNISTNTLSNKIYFIRGQFVMLDKDLSEFYQVDTKVFNTAMRRKIEEFGDTVFKLSESEYQEILAKTNSQKTSKNLPMAYTEKAAYKMAFVLSSKTALKVADIIVQVFLSVREGKYLPRDNDNQLALLNENIQWIKNNMQGTIVQNTFNAPVTLIQGQNNQVAIGTQEDVILKLITVMSNSEVVKNKELVTLLTHSIDQANKKDNKGLLDSLKNISSVGSSLATITQNLPAIIKLVSGLF
jgi:hypothetical protein